MQTVVKRESTFAPLSQTAYRRMWIGEFISNSGNAMQVAGAAWLMAMLTTSPTAVALVQAAFSLPAVVFSLFAGALADNFHRRHIMLVAVSAIFLFSATLTGVTYAGVITPWQLLLFTFLIRCGIAINSPSWTATVAEVVPKSHLPSAILLGGIAFNLPRSYAPALGGVIIATVGVTANFAINTICCLSLLLFLVPWRPAKAVREIPREAILPAMWAGIRYAALSTNIKNILLRTILFSFGGIVVIALMPLVTRDLLGGGPINYGVLLACFGIGGVTGALIIKRLTHHYSNEAILRVSAMIMAVGCVIISQSRHLPITAAATFISGIFWIPAVATLGINIQLNSPKWVTGRIVALFQTSHNFGNAVGAIFLGWVAQRLETPTAYLVAAGLLVGTALYGLRSPLPPSEALDLTPADNWKKPETALELTPVSGPIVIEIEYRIAEEDEEEFLEIMSRRRSLRMADGAREFSVSRSLHDVECWVVTYQFPTWVEYLRHQSRTTKEDTMLGEQLNRLVRDTGAPIIRRRLAGYTRSRG